MIVKDHTKYDSEKYKKLEELKVKIKDMWGINMDYNQVIELDNITIQDCCDLYNYRKITTTINDGKITNLEKGEKWIGKIPNIFGG